MRVGIIGVGQIESEECKKDVFSDQSTLIAKAALANAAIEIGDIDNVVLGEQDLVTGRTAAHMYTLMGAGGFLKDEIRINDDGLFALAQAYAGIKSGSFEKTLVLSTGISSEGPQELISNMRLDPFFHRHLGLHEKMGAAMQALQYRERYQVSEELSAKIAVKNRNNAIVNPYAHLNQGLSMDEALEAEFDCWPLRTTERAPWSDGGCALILASEAYARRVCQNPIWISGIGWSNETYYMGDKDLTQLTSVKYAAQRAYKMAGIKDSATEIDIAELFDLTTYHEMMTYEALGFCKKGEGKHLVDEGFAEPGGQLPVNLSGGVLSSNPMTASGLTRLVECVLQLQGQATDHQVQDAATGLAQSISGYAAQRACTVIIRR